MQKVTASINFDGKEYSLETGRFAKFANGAVMVKCDDAMVLVTVVAANVEKVDIDFLPLQVEYREKASSVGKIPGGFFRREGKPSDKEVLSARLIDRPIRPMIPKSWSFETQIIATVFSADPNFDPDTLAFVGASAALLISDIPFHGPISEVRVGRIEGQFIVNPSKEQLLLSDIDMTVAGTDSALLMVEGESKEISEDEFVITLEFAHAKIRELNNLQMELYNQYHMEKREFKKSEIPADFMTTIKNEIHDDLYAYVHAITSKAERSATRIAILEKAIAKGNEIFGENVDYAGKIDKLVSKCVKELEKNYMRLMILDENKRLDGRTSTDIRPITCEIGLLPRAHGSALFTRGETQSLTTTTLGTNRDEQIIDGLAATYNERFMLHYNFPPYSVGEVGRTMVSRREVGHGNLALRALKSMLPDAEAFPYTIRIVSDILESNGSSSMATVCAGSLSLFHAGVPMIKPVAGIAMGLIKEDDKVAVLSDILGDEDFLGDMDFKVTGTFEGITACQMDIKIEGLSMEIMKKALDQAKIGRYHILKIMNELIDKPKDDISDFAPRYQSIKIPQDTIGAVIGSGGETIRGLCTEYSVEINIENDGTVLIASTSKEQTELVIKAIQAITHKPQEGDVVMGTVKDIKDGIGAIVEISPKTSGLLHISQIAHERVENVRDFVKIGDKFEVKIVEAGRDGKFKLSRKALLPRPEGMAPDQPRAPRPEGGYDNRNSGDRRDGGGDRNRRPSNR